jgi:hypothetical protein
MSLRGTEFWCRLPAEEILKTAFAARGYGVVATLRPHQPGQIIPGVDIGVETQFDHPFRIVCETDKVDWDEQAVLNGRPTALLRDYKYFYRIDTD